MESYSDLPKLTQQIVKEEVFKEVRNLDLKKVASQLVMGKTNALEDAMFSAVVIPRGQIKMKSLLV